MTKTPPSTHPTSNDKNCTNWLETSPTGLDWRVVAFDTSKLLIDHRHASDSGCIGSTIALSGLLTHIPSHSTIKFSSTSTHACETLLLTSADPDPDPDPDSQSIVLSFQSVRLNDPSSLVPLLFLSRS